MSHDEDSDPRPLDPVEDGLWALNAHVPRSEASAPHAELRVVIVRDAPSSLVELHDEGDHLRVLIERPGLTLEQVSWELDQDLLWVLIGAEERELFLPRAMRSVISRQTQGIIQLRLDPEAAP